MFNESTRHDCESDYDSDQAAVMFGYSSEELQRLSFPDICIDETLEQCRGHLRELSEGVRLQYEIETLHRRKDGTFLPVNTYFSAVSERHPNQRRFLTVTVDVSGRPKMLYTRPNRSWGGSHD